MTPAEAWSRYGEALGYGRSNFLAMSEPMLKGGERPQIWVVPLVELREHRGIRPAEVGWDTVPSQMIKAVSDARTQLFLQLGNGLAGGAIGAPGAPSRRVTSVLDRLGQPKFRDELFVEFGGACCLTGCDVPEALQAAHIVPFSEEATFLAEAGLLLRADIHNLFDLHLITIAIDGSIKCVPRIEAARKALGLHAVATLPAGRFERREAFLARHRGAFE